MSDSIKVHNGTAVPVVVTESGRMVHPGQTVSVPRSSERVAALLASGELVKVEPAPTPAKSNKEG